MDWEMRAASLILFLGILLATTQNGIAERRIVCYYTNWSVYRPGTAKFSPQNINPYLCTHLIYAFGGFTKDNALRPFDKYQDIEKGGYAKFTGLKTYNKNLKTMLAIGGWNEGSSRFSPMVADAARRREFVRNAVKFLRQNHFDGLDLDWEYPAFRDGGKPRDKDNYANLVQELREEFERESSKTGRTRLLLSMAMPAGIEYIDKGYDVPRLNDYLDFINLLSYDYHSAYEPAVNHHAPLYPLEEDNEYNYDAELTIDYTISHLVEKGASTDKIVLGIPTYGRSYTLFNQDATELGSPADGPGVEGEATREKGYLAYYEICENISESDEWEIVQPNPNAMGPYAFKGDQWVGYDDEDVVKLKARYVNEKKLGGIMFWSIDNDDFRGKCHGRPYPLIEAAKEVLLTRNTIDKTKSVDSRKKTRIQSTQSNTRKLGSSSRRTTTTPAPKPITKKRVSSSRPNYRTVTRSRSDEEQEDREVSRRSYEPPSEEDSEARNTVRVTEKTERPRNRSRDKTRSGSADRGSRRKQSRRKGQTKTDDDGESLSNKLTTPEPPTTPDPGTDFKCEDEGFFPHPRDCKKYFWCLDSGPSGLGVVAHQFTCPSGLVFNKGADSCDYPRNVICPKSKTSVVSTTKSPITAATSRTTYLYSTTTAKTEEPEDEYDSEEDYIEDEDEESEEEEVREEPKTTTTAKPLVYKTLTRNRPSTTTTTTTTTLRPSEPERIISGEDEEDPKVIKELIDLIKKAGGIEELERQLLLQERNSDATLGSETAVTPATISRSLYERVLSRQTSRINNQRPAFSSSETSYVNGPGRAQFEGLDDIPEVKSLRRSQKPQYVTIERPKSVTKETSNEDVDENEEDDDKAEITFSEEQSVANPLDTSSTQRVTPSYVNIRRNRPSSTTSRKENDVEGKEVEEEQPIRRRRPSFSSKRDNETSRSQNRGSTFRNSEKNRDSESAEKDDSSTTAKSRYASVQRFRSTTSKIYEDSPSSSAPSSELTSDATLPPNAKEYPEAISSTASPSTTSTTSTSTEVITVISVEPPENSSSVSATVGTIGPTVEPVKLVEDSATEILLTTVPASSSSQSTTTSVSRSTVAAVSLPRPFGFTRRRSGLSEVTTTTTTPSGNQARSKVADAKAIRLPTLKELIGYPTYDRITTMPSVLLHLLRFDVDNDISRQNVEESVEGTSESYPPTDLASDGERISRLLEETTEEIGDSWLRQASESKAKSRIPKRKDFAIEDQEASVTNAIQIDGQGNSPISVYLKPTTMRGIPLASLTPSSVMRGFYVTRSGYDPSTSTSIDSTTVEQQTEATLSSDVSTIDEIVTVTPSYQNKSKSGIANNDVIINNGDVNVPEEKFSTLSPLTISTKDSDNLENVSKSPAKSTSNRVKSLRNNTNRGTTPSNAYVVRSTARPATRRAIALAVSKYNELTTPLWTGKRIVARKRNRTTISPIKDSIRRTESGFVRATTSILDSSSTIPFAISSASTSTTRKLSVTPTISTISIFASESTISPEILNVNDELAISTDVKTEESRNYTTTEATRTLTDSVNAATRSIASINDLDAATTASSIIAAPVITDSPITTTSLTAAITNPSAVATTDAAVEETSAIEKHAKISPVPTTRMIENIITPSAVNIEDKNSYTTTNYSVVAATANTIATESVITVTPAIASTEVETISTIADYFTVTIPSIKDPKRIVGEVITEPTITFENASTEIETTSAITDYSASATTVSPREDTTVAALMTVLETANTEIETASTIMNSSEISTIPTTEDTREVATESAITTAFETTNTEAEVASTIANYTEITAAINLADVDSATSAVTTITPAIVTTLARDDSNVITTSAYENIPRRIPSTVVDTSATTIASRSTSAIPSRITNADTILMSSTDPSTSTVDSSTTFIETPNIDVNDASGAFSVAVTTKSTWNTGIPSFETSQISTTTALPNIYLDSGLETSIAEMTTSSIQEDQTTITSKNTQVPPTVLSVAIPITNTANVDSEESTIPSTIAAASRKSIATTLRATAASTHKPTSTSKISGKESTTPDSETDVTAVTSRATQSRARDRTNSRHDATDRQFGWRSSGRTAVHRRVVNRPNEWIERSTTARPSVSSRHRVAVYRGRPRRPSGYSSSSRVVQENQRRRIAQKRRRTEAAGNITRSDESAGDVRNATEAHITYNRAENTVRGTKVSKRIRTRVEEEGGTAIFAENTTLSVQPSNSTEAPRGHRENRKIGGRRKLVLKRIKSQSNETSTTEGINGHDSPSEKFPDSSQSNARVNENLPTEEKTRRRMRVVLKSVRPKFEERNSTAEEASTSLSSTEKNLEDDISNNPHIDRKVPNERSMRRKVVLKSIRPRIEETNSTIEEENASADSNDENLQGSFSSDLRARKNLINRGNRRRTRVVLKSVRPKYKEENSTTKELDVDLDESLQGSFSSNFRTGKNLSDGKNTRRRMRVVLKNIRPRFEEKDLPVEETSADSETEGEDLQGDFSSKLYASDNLPSEDAIGRRMRIAFKEINSESREEEATAEETSESSAPVDDGLRSNISSNLPVHDNLSGEERTTEEQAVTEQPTESDAGPYTTETSVRVDKHTDRPSNEVNLSKNSGETTNRKLDTGHSNRQRRPAAQSTVSPLINTLSGTLTTNRRARPVTAALSSRMDLVDTFESTESYTRSTGAESDQRAEVSDQSIRAQEFAVILADPPASSSDIGRTPLLEDAIRRKISTTITPRTDPITTSGTISRYDANFRNRQRSRAKNKPTVNATTRPRRPLPVDYDYYEDEVPIVVGKSVLNSKLFLTSRGTIRCLDQGNFPHPYSCKKFITCARMVNGQVIGTEYTCPEKLSFDPVGGICNWSAGLGCKE